MRIDFGDPPTQSVGLKFAHAFSIKVPHAPRTGHLRPNLEFVDANGVFDGDDLRMEAVVGQ